MPAVAASPRPRFLFCALQDVIVAGFANPGDRERNVFSLKAGDTLPIDLVHWVCTADRAECDYAIYHPRKLHETSDHAGLFRMERVEESAL